MASRSTSGGLCAEVLKQAVTASQAVPIPGERADDVIESSSSDTALVGAFEEEIDREIGTRLRSDRDFDPEKFPNAEKKFRPN